MEWVVQISSLNQELLQLILFISVQVYFKNVALKYQVKYLCICMVCRVIKEEIVLCRKIQLIMNIV